MTISLDPYKDLEIDISESAVCVSQSGGTQAVSTTAVANKYYQFKDNATGILPPVVRYISGDNLCYIVERPPFIARVTIDYASVDEIRLLEESSSLEDEYAGDVSEYDTVTYNLPIPWTVYWIRFVIDDDHYRLSQFSMFFKNNQIFYEDEPLYLPLLPNVESFGSVCVGGSYNFMFPMSEGIAYALNNAINTVWCNNFNLDIHPPFVPREFFDYADLGEKPDPRHYTFAEDHDYFDLFQVGKDSVSILQQIYKAWEGLSMQDVLAISWDPPANDAYTTVGKLIEISDRKHSTLNKDEIINAADPFFTFMKSIL